MANGYRISEASDFRITEDGASRLTEGYSIVDSSLNATGTVGVAGYKHMFGSSNLLAVGSRAVVGERTRAGRSSMTASGSISTLSLLKNLGHVESNGIGSINSTGLKRLYGVSSLVSSGTSSFNGLKILYGNITTGTDEVTRITESGDIRVLENDTDTRTAIAAYGNVIFATIVGNPSKTFFSSQPYYKDNGTWKTFIPNVKWNGAWTQNLKIYQHTNGAWKRSY